MAVNNSMSRSSLSESSSQCTDDISRKSPLHRSCELCSSCENLYRAAAATTTTATATTRCFTMCQVRLHNTAESAWLVAGRDIYDATEYLQSDQHPGGKVSIFKKAGGAVDCTEDLHFHSNHGKKLWQHYHVGKLVPCQSAAAADLQDRQWWQFWA